jgi:hypothetical protein
VVAMTLMIGASSHPAFGGELTMTGVDTVAHDGKKGGNNSGAGGN